ncbi:MAG: hypothetical protein QNI99_05270 [Woeseiaceae bacterium]|nr:hypothetical protein [Woeseiaceae bacterium]
MKYTIERVSPSSVAKVVSVTAALLFVLFFLIMLVISFAQSGVGESGFNLNISNVGIMMIVMPFIYMVGVYITSYIGALAFNVATRWVGGIQLELSD